MIKTCPPNVQNLTGVNFGRLEVVGYDGVRQENGLRYHYWRCRCACSSGEEISVKGASLRGGNTKSCGCLRRESIGNRSRLHGRSDTKEFRAWCAMLERCYNENSSRYPRWGGRGITVCERWRGAFLCFLEDMGEAPSPDHTLERIDNDGPYCKENCRWAPHAEQARNTRKNRKLTHDGRTMNLSDWAREVGIRPDILSTRLRRGWTIEEAILTPFSGFGGSRITRGRRARAQA